MENGKVFVLRYRTLDGKTGELLVHGDQYELPGNIAEILEEKTVEIREYLATLHAREGDRMKTPEEIKDLWAISSRLRDLGCTEQDLEKLDRWIDNEEIKSLKEGA